MGKKEDHHHKTKKMKPNRTEDTTANNVSSPSDDVVFSSTKRVKKLENVGSLSPDDGVELVVVERDVKNRKKRNRKEDVNKDRGDFVAVAESGATGNGGEVVIDDGREGGALEKKKLKKDEDGGDDMVGGSEGRTASSNGADGVGVGVVELVASLGAATECGSKDERRKSKKRKKGRNGGEAGGGGGSELGDGADVVGVGVVKLGASSSAAAERGSKDERRMSKKRKKGKDGGEAGGGGGSELGGEAEVEGGGKLEKSKKKRKRGGDGGDKEVGNGIRMEDVNPKQGFECFKKDEKKRKQDMMMENEEEKKKKKDRKEEKKKDRKEEKKKDRREEEKKKKEKSAERTTKRVSFAEDVDVFPSSDDPDDSHAVQGEDGLVRGKRYSKEEDQLIKDSVLNYIRVNGLGENGLDMVLHCSRHRELRGCWAEIAEAIPWRPKVSVYLRAHTLFLRDERHKWTQDELDTVRKFHEKYGPDWKTLGEAMGKFRYHVSDAWRRVKYTKLKRGKWSQEEYQNLFDLVNADLRMRAFQERKTKYGMLRDNISWDAISGKLETRNHVLCCTKWYNQLSSPMVAKGEWLDTDDYCLLIELHQLDAACMEDVDWDNILEHRSGQVCRKRWNQMVRHLDEHQKKSFSEHVEVLYNRYCPDVLEAREIYNSKPAVD